MKGRRRWRYKRRGEIEPIKVLGSESSDREYWSLWDMTPCSLVKETRFLCFYVRRMIMNCAGVGSRSF
jgi:hypothetical protein